MRVLTSTTLGLGGGYGNAMPQLYIQKAASPSNLQVEVWNVAFHIPLLNTISSKNGSNMEHSQRVLPASYEARCYTS